MVAPVAAPLAADPAEIALAAYNQNFETFRALNALMWQIPLIAITLTGGLWFGVSRLDELPLFRLGLLALAFGGNLGLIVVLERLRYIIGQYLSWMEGAFARGYVSAPGAGWMTRNRTVKLVFQLMLGFAAVVSLVLSGVTMATMNLWNTPTKSADAIAWYDAHAVRLADDYEGLDAVRTHLRLFEMLRGLPPQRVLDVGAGTGRDAAAIASLGHHVTAVEPSANMRRLARRLHFESGITWISDTLPELAATKGMFDVVLLSAVWMHVLPKDRKTALHRLAGLAAPGGRIDMTLRLGPDEAERDVYRVTYDEVGRLALAEGLRVEDLA